MRDKTCLVTLNRVAFWNHQIALSKKIFWRKKGKMSKYFSAKNKAVRRRSTGRYRSGHENCGRIEETDLYDLTSAVLQARNEREIAVKSWFV